MHLPHHVNHKQGRKNQRFSRCKHYVSVTILESSSCVEQEHSQIGYVGWTADVADRVAHAVRERDFDEDQRIGHKQENYMEDTWAEGGFASHVQSKQKGNIPDGELHYRIEFRISDHLHNYRHR